MSDHEQEKTQPAEPGGAFGKDLKYGTRLDQMFALNEPFLLLGGKIEDEKVSTTFGEAEVAKLLVQKLDHETGQPKGPPFRVNTVLSAVVEKIKALTPEELANGPIVELRAVAAKSRGGKTVTVMSLQRFLNEADTYAEFGVTGDDVSRVADLTRPASERIPY